MHNKLNYKDSGVDIEQSNKLVASIKPMAKRTHRAGVLNGIGGFGALFEVPVDRYQQPILVSGTDGVGTKLMLAVKMNRHDSIGIDLVAMCVNDILTLGAEPLFFLDYFATGKLQAEQGAAILGGIAKGCELAQAALIGGETAEMPGVYQGDDYDLAGFCVGVVEKKRIIDGSGIQAGHQLVALASSGVHANGFSLVRNIIERGQHDLNMPFDGSTLGDTLLTATKIYVSDILSLLNSTTVYGMAHITGGGLLENIPRILPQGLCAHVDSNSWQWPPIFQWLQQQGNVDTVEMQRTFNLGVGMVIVVSQHDLAATLQHFGESAWHLGEIQARDSEQAEVVIAG